MARHNPALKAICMALLTAAMLPGFSACAGAPEAPKEYGVFLDADAEDLERMGKYETVVLDAQYFTREDIQQLKNAGCQVYSYLNIGSIESFRDYYPEYEDLALGDYENWEGEKWVDVSAEKWQMFMDEKEEELLAKGVDGFFVDNCDVYYFYPREEIYSGVEAILRGTKGHSCSVIINGGDEFVRRYLAEGGNPTEIADGINQEGVFTAIDFAEGTFGYAKEEDREYFSEYLTLAAENGLQTYVIEYATGEKEKEQAIAYAKQQGYIVYVSDSLNLDE